MTPEEKARQQIDRQLHQAGWLVQDYRQIDISAGSGVAVREFPLTTGEADYMLYADAKARLETEKRYPQKRRLRVEVAFLRNELRINLTPFVYLLAEADMLIADRVEQLARLWVAARA